MTDEQIIEKLRHVMKQSSQAKVDWGQLAPETTIASLGFDSLSILDLIYDIQQLLGVEFEAADMINVKTVGQLASFLRTRLPS